MLFSFHCVLEIFELFVNGSTCFVPGVASIGDACGIAFGASSSIGGNSFTGSSASIVSEISGSTSDIYIIFYLFCLYVLYILSIWTNLRNINIKLLILISRGLFNYLMETEC